MATHTQTHDNVEMLCLPVYSDVTFLFFFFAAAEAQNLMTVIKQKNIRCNGTFFVC